MNEDTHEKKLILFKGFYVSISNHFFLSFNVERISFFQVLIKLIKLDYLITLLIVLYTYYTLVVHLFYTYLYVLKQ